MKDYFLLSFRNLKRRGLRSWLTVIGIFIGIAAVVALISLGQALQLAISSQFTSLEPDKIQLKNADNGMAPPGSTAAKSLTQDEIDLISNIKYINAIYGTYLRPVTLNYNDKSQFTFVQSLPSNNEYLELIYRKYNKPEQGNFLLSYNNHRILLGNSFLTNNIFGKEIKVGDNLKINNKEFRVVGFLEETGSFTINQAVYLLDVDLEDLLNLKQNYDLIEIYVEDQKYIDEVSNQIKEIIRKERKEEVGDESFSIDTPGSTLSNINTVLIMVNAVVIAIASIALLIGGIGVANTMFTSIVERKKEIGIMKAIGAKNKDIMKIFLIESGLLGFFGGLAGALFGLTIAYLVSSIARQIIGGELFKVTLSWPLLIGASLFSFIIGLIAGYIPARQASKLNPVQALRG
ncbi:MAG: ABC transporter permease [Candidatus Nanoarchaeia archaeon]|nr:ABC transporter permease [Candidatus Nanoarchaeia archaeon]MDD3993682.1 ABC transporter permease [Candidatus Nanoarchaeia archaeon]MDD4563662.1 ABC transporter permease [Candidatus Nanoarchaeia archaeon]